MAPAMRSSAPRVAPVPAAEGPSPAPLGTIDRTSSHKGPCAFAFWTAPRTYRYRGSSSDPPSALHSACGRAKTSARMLIAVASAGSPKTTSCSPNRINLPGADADMCGDCPLRDLILGLADFMSPREPRRQADVQSSATRLRLELLQGRFEVPLLDRDFLQGRF